MNESIQIFRSIDGFVVVALEDAVYLLRKSYRWQISVTLSEDTALTFADLSPQEQQAVYVLALCSVEERHLLHASVL